MPKKGRDLTEDEKRIVDMLGGVLEKVGGQRDAYIEVLQRIAAEEPLHEPGWASQQARDILIATGRQVLGEGWV